MRRPELFALLPATPGANSFVPCGKISSRNPADLGPDRGAFASNPGRSFGPRAARISMRARTFTCLCDRKSLAWSELGQYHCLNCGRSRHRDCNDIWVLRAPGSAGKAVPRDVERPSLNLGNWRLRRTTVAGGSRKRPRCADKCGLSLKRMKWRGRNSSAKHRDSSTVGDRGFETAGHFA